MQRVNFQAGSGNVLPFSYTVSVIDRSANVLMSRSIKVIYGIQVILLVRLYCSATIGSIRGAGIQSQFNHMQIVSKGLDPTHICSHTFFTAMFSCLRSSRGAAHFLLRFSPLHHRLIILSHSMEAVNSDTHYKSGVKDGWRSLHSLFI